MAGWRKVLIISVALVASAASLASGSESSGSGSSKDSGSAVTTTGDATETTDATSASGDADEVDDVKVNSCARDEIGFASANITVTNNSSDPSDYMIEITFTSKDGKTQVGTGNSIISNLASGQSKTEDVSALEEAGDGEFVCTVSSVDRYASS